MKRISSLVAMTAVASAMIVGLVVAQPSSGERRAWLGIYTQSVDDNIAEGFKLPVKSGAIINEVVEDSPADQAGLMDNDIIIAVDGTKVETAEDLTSAISNHAVGDIVTVKVLRDGKQREFKVTLADRQESKSGNKMYGLGNSDDMNNGASPHTRMFKYFSQTLSDSYIGVELTSLTDQLRTYFGVTGDRGALVASVEKETPADKAGIRAGDVIVGVDGKDVDGVDAIRQIIGDMKKGDKVSLNLIRDRKEMTVPVEVAEHASGSGRMPNMHALNLPDVGNIPTPDVPRMKGLWYGTKDGKEMDDLRDEMAKLRDQIADLKKQIEGMQNTRK